VPLDLLTVFQLCKFKALEIVIDFVSASVGIQANCITFSGRKE
jgi:hypothetical protein